MCGPGWSTPERGDGAVPLRRPVSEALLSGACGGIAEARKP